MTHKPAHPSHDNSDHVDEPDLAARFDAQRAADAQRAIPFAAMRSNAEQQARTRENARVPLSFRRWLPVLATALVCLGIGIFRLLPVLESDRQRRHTAEAARAIQSLEWPAPPENLLAWQAPTDFLLDTTR